MAGLDVTREELDSIICAYPGELRFALAVMQDMQRQFNYVPREGLLALAGHVDCTVADLYSMATFYRR